MADETRNNSSNFEHFCPRVKFRAHSHSGDIRDTFKLHSRYIQVTFTIHSSDIQVTFMIHSVDIYGFTETFLNIQDKFKGHSIDFHDTFK